MKKIIAAIFGLVLALGPLSACGKTSNVYGPANFPQFFSDPSIYQMMCEKMEDLTNAIQERDIAAIEAMMCLSIKQNTEDLPDKIAELIDAIEGEIIDSSWSSSGGQDERKVRYGDVMQQRGYDLSITTTAGEYMLYMSWVVNNSAEPEEEGIRGIYLRSDEVDLFGISVTKSADE